MAANYKSEDKDQEDFLHDLFILFQPEFKTQRILHREAYHEGTLKSVSRGFYNLMGAPDSEFYKT